MLKCKFKQEVRVILAKSGYKLTLRPVLPISQVSSVASCIHRIACLLPLEKALHLSPPARWQEERERKRAMQARITTRRQDDEHDPQGARTPVSYEKDGGADDEHAGQWTAGDILQGWAEYRGYGTSRYFTLLMFEAEDAPQSDCQSRPPRYKQSRK